MKISIIGPGNIAAIHAAEILKLGHSIQLVVGRDEEKTKQFAQKWKAEGYSTQVDDLFNSGIDVIHICTPPNSHYELIKRAINNNINVVCEKPLTLDRSESEALLQIAKTKDVVVALNFNVRYHQALSDVKTMIANEELGSIRLIQASYMQEFHILPTHYSWRYDKNVSGSLRAISEIGSHIIDLISYLTQERITAVSAITRNYDPIRYLKDGVMYQDQVEGSEEITVESEDVALLMFKLEHQAVGSIVLSEVSHGKTNEIDIHIDGSKQSIWWNNENPYRTFKGAKNQGLSLSIDSFSGGFTDTFSMFFKEVYKDIESQTQSGNYANLVDGHYNTVVTEAILKSSKENSKWIEIE